MVRIVLGLEHRVKVQIRRIRRATQEAGLATRCQIVLHAAKGRTSRAIAEAVGCHRSWVSRVLTRFRDEGVPGLLDRREDNGQVKVTEEYLGQLHELVAARPTDYGRRRPTWTRELLVAVMAEQTHVRIAVGTRAGRCTASAPGVGAPSRWCGVRGERPRKTGGWARSAGCWRVCPATRSPCMRTRWTFT